MPEHRKGDLLADWTCKPRTFDALQAEARCRAAAEAALAVERRAAAALAARSERSMRARLAPTLATLRGLARDPGAARSPPAMPCADAAGLRAAGGGGPAVRPGEQGLIGQGGICQAPADAPEARALADAELLEGSGEAGCAGAGAGAGAAAGEPGASACGSRGASPARSACGRPHGSAASHASCAGGGCSRPRAGCLGRSQSDAAAAAGAGPRDATLAGSVADGGSTADCSEYASAVASPVSASAGTPRFAPALPSAPATAAHVVCGSPDGTGAGRGDASAGAAGGSGPDVHGMYAAAGHAGTASSEAGSCVAEGEGSGLGSGPVAGPADADAHRRAAEAEAAAARLSAALTATAQRVKAREEQCRRLQAQLGHAQLRLVRHTAPCESASLGAWAR